MSETPTTYTTPEASGATFTPSPKRFRVWDGEKMHEPTDLGDFYLNQEGEPCAHEPTYMDRDWSLVWLQSTGLHDADGVEIFEGDLLEYALGTPPDVVCWKQGSWWIGRLSRLGQVEGAYVILRVVGNVYENPGLLG